MFIAQVCYHGTLLVKSGEESRWERGERKVGRRGSTEDALYASHEERLAGAGSMAGEDGPFLL